MKIIKILSVALFSIFFSSESIAMESFNIPTEICNNILAFMGPKDRDNIRSISIAWQKLVDGVRKPKSLGGMGLTDNLPLIHSSQVLHNHQHKNSGYVIAKEKLYFIIYSLYIININDKTVKKTVFHYEFSPNKIIKKDNHIFLIGWKGISVLDIDTDEIIRTIKVPLNGNPVALLLDDNIYLSSQASQAIFILSTEDHTWERFITPNSYTGQQKKMLCIGNFIYINSYFYNEEIRNYQDGHVVIFDTKNKIFVKTLGYSKNMVDIMAINNKLYIYISDDNYSEVLVLDPKSNTIIQTIDNMTPSQIRFSFANKLYLINTGENGEDNFVIDTINNIKLDDYIDIGDIKDLILINNYIFTWKENNITVIDMNDITIVKKIMLPKSSNINDVILVNDRLWFFSSNGKLDIIDIGGFI